MTEDLATLSNKYGEDAEKHDIMWTHEDQISSRAYTEQNLTPDIPTQITPIMVEDPIFAPVEPLQPWTAKNLGFGSWMFPQADGTPQSCSVNPERSRDRQAMPATFQSEASFSGSPHSADTLQNSGREAFAGKDTSRSHLEFQPSLRNEDGFPTKQNEQCCVQ